MADEAAAAGRGCTLNTIKVVHTTVWAFFVGCIVALPIAGGLGRFRLAGVLSALVLLECSALAVNRCRCPLSNLAERYTGDRSPNFDIYMPEWLARYNKQIFGTIFLLNELIVLGEWIWGRGR